jgi:hypothetical protein
MDAEITAETFAPHVGEAVTLSDDHRLTLVSVDVPKRARGGFALILRGPPSPVAPEGLHSLALEDGRRFELYVIPIHTPSRDHQDYQIVFN